MLENLYGWLGATIISKCPNGLRMPCPHVARVRMPSGFGYRIKCPQTMGADKIQTGHVDYIMLKASNNENANIMLSIIYYFLYL